MYTEKEDKEKETKGVILIADHVQRDENKEKGIILWIVCNG